MKVPTKSLAFRLVLAAIAVQGSCIAVAIVVFPLIAPFTPYRAMADATVRRLVIASLQPQADGTVAIVGTGPLQAYVASRPNLRFAARLADGRYVGGSASELVDTLKRIGPLVPRPGSTFDIARPGHLSESIIVSTQVTSRGPLVLATAGDVFGTDDLRSFFGTFVSTLLPAYSPVLFGVLFGIPMVVRQMFRPLQAAARTASLIDVQSLDQRLPLAGIPSEFAPLVLAINEALDRLSDGWTRQRLFTANAAHELRTPVAVLQARVETMPSDAPLRSALTRDVRRLGLLIDQLLAIARLEQRENALRPIELVGLLRELVADWGPVAIRSGVAIGLEVPAHQIWVLGDARALEGAVAALIDNALKIEPSGESVEVVVASGACITVRDHGPGVDAADRNSVFEPFWRKDERPTGSGLGLATVRETARLHGGHARVDGEAGKGAVFELFIPEIARPAQA